MINHRVSIAVMTACIMDSGAVRSLRSDRRPSTKASSIPFSMPKCYVVFRIIFRQPSFSMSVNLNSLISYLVDQLGQVAVADIQALRSASSFITDRRQHSTIHRRGPNLYGCRCFYLGQFTSARHFCTFVACLPVTPQNSSLHHFLS